MFYGLYNWIWNYQDFGSDLQWSYSNRWMKRSMVLTLGTFFVCLMTAVHTFLAFRGG